MASKKVSLRDHFLPAVILVIVLTGFAAAQRPDYTGDGGGIIFPAPQPAGSNQWPGQNSPDWVSMTQRQGNDVPKRKPGPPLVYKSSVQHVLVPAIVTDKSGRFVAGLKKEDFAIYENGKARKILSVDEVHVDTNSMST